MNDGHLVISPDRGSRDRVRTAEEPGALDRLARLQVPGPVPLRRRPGPPPTMGYQPGLDGIRAVSVLIVILYHAGFSWMHGGFFGVEVFFVVSGFLITSLLLDEESRTGGVDLRQFWLRRARRLLPALGTMLLAVTLWATFFGDEHLAQLRHDMLPAVFYVSNWAQVLGDVPYFTPTDPPLLRHLWSLAVEEQWYLLWPLAFLALVALVGRRRSGLAVGLIVASFASMTFSAVLAGSGAPTVWLAGADPDRWNFLYLNTVSRASGLLLGAACAFVWRPWRWVAAAQVERRGLDVAGLGAMVVVLVVSATRAADVLVSASLYRVWLPLVTIASMVAVAMVVHPGARLTRAVFSWRPLVEVGKRSYGLYLWHWPVFVFGEVRGHAARFVPAIVVTVAVSEICYRFVETPVRTGALSRRWASLGGGAGAARQRIGALLAVSLLFLGGTLVARLRTAEAVDVAFDDTEVQFDADALAVPSSEVGSPDGVAADDAGAPAVTEAPATTAPRPVTLPRRVAIVGDSQAHSLAINLPSGIEGTFTISDGSVEGCGVLTSGRSISTGSTYSRSFDSCAGAPQEWGTAAAAANAEVALVVIGAWEVFDVETSDGTVVRFGAPEHDRMLLDGLGAGIDALRAAGARVGLLEVACMRPVDVQGAGTPALADRADDTRVAHLNELLRRVADADPGDDVSFVDGPRQWCDDPAVATDLAYRWDGVHVYKPGANLIYTTVAPTLLAL